jgi:hypothetical protein
VAEHGTQDCPLLTLISILSVPTHQSENGEKKYADIKEFRAAEQVTVNS